MYEYELVAACHKLLHDMFRLQPGETLAITLDASSSQPVADAMAQAVNLKLPLPERRIKAVKDFIFFRLLSAQLLVIQTHCAVSSARQLFSGIVGRINRR